MYEVEYRTVGKEDGKLRWVAARGRGIFEDDRCVRVVGVAIEITARKLTENALRDSEAKMRELNESLEHRVSEEVGRRAAAEEALRQSQKLEAMGQLTGGVAHDFNNLLTPIVGSLDMLQRKNVGDQRDQRLIEGALQSAERARMLVQRLLAFARRQPLQPVAVDLKHVIEGMADLVSSTTGPQVQVVVDVASDLPPAIADPNQLEMALLNLAVNARDAMPDGGTLTLSAALAEGDARGRSCRGPIYQGLGCRHRRWHGRSHLVPRDRTLFLDQGTGQGHWPWPVDGPRACHPAGRHADDRQQAG